MLDARLGSDNVFRDLGFPEAEAQVLLLHSDLLIHIRKIIAKLDLTQAEAAKRAGITQPRMHDLIKGRTHKFTLDALVNVAANLGYSVKLTFKKSRRVGKPLQRTSMKATYFEQDDILQIRLTREGQDKPIVREVSPDWHTNISYAEDGSIVEIVLLGAKKQGLLPIEIRGAA